ncbi:P-loop containing nucleoside triphosphate hydrolase protein [Hanseniaspora valbyensis NRRL Y-1626]|uniref:Adenylate kinase isoenzyme 6 homolog n=1 Tax=Hanseniaspora valbyensis NRRL Y-1626 TaxID=766949 RepID=A0A1B7TK77_9ASCO|nr:P-loop containing nucleoside triphosphate hydrolase protein [Hanseniaspora valbyensis NRRL Y-1626]
MAKDYISKKITKKQDFKTGFKINTTAVEKALSTKESESLNSSSESEEINSESENEDLPKTRYRPNIIITGTPGCGKSTLSSKLNEFAKKEDIFESYDESRKSHVIDEEELLNRLEKPLREGSCIIDWHCNDIFPERLIDLVIVLKCGTSALYDRLQARKYHDSKIQENIDAEIMSVVLEDALESYDKRIVIELPSETEEQVEDNLEKIIAWYKQWLKDNKSGVTNEIDEFYIDREMPEIFDSDEE